MTTHDASMRALADRLIMGELTGLILYRQLVPIAGAAAKKTLALLIAVEETHLSFWENFFGIQRKPIGVFRNALIFLEICVARIFGDRAIFLILGSTEVHAINDYFTLWERYRGTPTGYALKTILTDELEHEETIITGTTAGGLRGEYIRNLFLGLNDGLVEILGVVSGLLAAFEHTSSVIVAGLTVAIAGSFSMAAGVFAAENSENEIIGIQTKKERILSSDANGGSVQRGTNTFVSASIVGISYFFGAMIPILPIIFGGQSILVSFLASGFIVILVSTIISFITGMNAKKRIFLNIVILSLAILITYAMGTIAKSVFDISM